MKVRKPRAVVRAGRDIAGGTRADVEIVGGDDSVPAILLSPGAALPAPTVLLLHGLGSHKERMADTVGEALVRRGIAALAVDLPLHGERAAPNGGISASNPMELLRTWKLAVAEARLAIDYLAEQPQVDENRIAILGYSLGGFLANIVAAETPAVRAIVLAASGDLPDDLPFGALVRTVVDPARAVRGAAGRPLLMINGRYDRTVKPEQAERLFAAAGEPKTMRWYAGGHWPPDREIDFAAEWLANQLHAVSSRL